MVKKYTANFGNWLKTKLNSVASTIKMNGTQSAGSSDLIARADHVHPTDTSRAASNHTHGNLSNDGKVGSTANKPLITGTNGVVQVGSFGTGANTFCQGNDSRLSDARTPTSHTHTKSQITDFPTSMPPTSHTHTKSQITDFPTSMPPTSHTHFFDDISITQALGANSDLNDYTDVGIYTCGSTNSATLANRPPYFGNYSLLIENKKYNSETIVQYVTALVSESPLTWFRFKGTSNWSQWTHMGGCSQTVPANTDLNDLTDLTIYSCNTNNSATLGNKPFSDNRACIIQNKAYNNHNYFIQFVYPVMSDNSLNEIFYRIKGSSNWTNWRKIITDVDINALEETINVELNNKSDKTHNHAFGTLSNGNIDEIIDDGVYGIPKSYISSGAITGTMPPTDRTSGTRSFLLETRKYDTNSSIQFAYILTTTKGYNRVFYRSRTSNTWFDWEEIIQASDIDVINTALGGKAPTNHAVNANTYGLGTTGVYGHVKTINGLTQSTHSDGLALSAYQGKVLNNKISAITINNSSSATTYTSLSNSWTGTVRTFIRNGFIIVTYENLKKASTTSSYDDVTDLAFNNSMGTVIYAEACTSDISSGVIVRVSADGKLQARCLNANYAKYGHIILPIN